ncbi:MAG: alpha/beta hydrolase [Verrucomicrobiota bacterium]|jgi:acetyl esterase/lipase|nr:alpha/beta hydrolase [Verrucomicrobiota bacterium]
MPNTVSISGLALCLLFLSSVSILAQKQKTTLTTYTYKKVGNLEIKLDVHRPADKKIRPLAVWIHGGALINGGRSGIGPGRTLLVEGYVVVSIDYRLAPETKLPEIIADVEDAFKWIRKHGREKFWADTSKIAVLGGSAGGHLTFTTGFRVKPPPTVLVAYWGYGDLIGPWLSQPSPHARHQSRTLIPTQMKAVEAGPPVANSYSRKGNGGAYYQTCRKLGIWPEKVSGFAETDAKKFAPYMAALNVSPKYPPTLMIHGTEDTDVPHEQSLIMAREFKKHGVPYRLISVKDGEHGLGGGKPEDIKTACAAMLPFVLKYMK